MKLTFKSKYFYTDYTRKYKEEGSFYQLGEEPWLVVLKPTLKCCANCKHCMPRSKRFSTDFQLSLGDYDRLLKQLKELGTKQICISGGEPLIYKDVIPLIKLVTKNGMRASINTNGWFLTLGKFKELMDAGVMCLNLSIDSPFADKHDELRKLPGLFNRATRNIKEAKESGIPFKLNLRMVLSKHNYKNICTMIDLAISLHADSLSIDMIEADSENKFFLLNGQEILDFKKNYVPKLVNKINGLEINDNLKTFNNKQLLDMYNINFNSIENFENGLYWPDNRIKNKCDIPSTFMIIEGDGMVLPCNAVEYNRDKIIGNINEMNIKQLWNSDKWNEFRKNKLDFCRECPMNMSYVLVFNDDEIERECRVDNFTTQKIEKMIMIDDKKEYITERTEEYLSFFKRDKEFIKKINERYAIESLEYKLNFLYPIFFKNMENDKQIFNSYKNASEFYALRQLLGRPEKFESQLHIFDFMKENLKQGARVMDYGCCVGDFSLLFAKMGYSVVILDLDILTFDFALERFKNRSIKVENYRIGENMKVELLRKKVDFVFCRDVLEHTRHPLYILDYFYESLNNDGYLYTSTMNPGDEIYIGAEHLEETILIAKTEKYKKFFEKRFESLGIKGLYKKRERKKDE